ncbi:MAG TPA: aldehyde ferredoxin oxidoreductase C-terminal domain-containing protein, partial [Minicystis sp.]|nr:aldehyde ferredoxin oxidoreductase C-terminal domain-containing protein [Minicystis sp.]
DAALLDAVIGGVGLGALLLLSEAPRGVDPLAAEAPVVFAFGPLAGTPLTTSAKLAVVAKSPLTGRIGDALSSSSFALAGKRTGFDAIVVRGAAPRPSVLLVDGAEARLEPADGLWGSNLSPKDVCGRLAARHPGFEFAAIGVAGERLVRFANLVNGERHAGRGGLGAVLGSKRLKAVGVRGHARVPIADPARAAELAKDLAARSLGPATAKYRELGTVANLAAFNRLAALPTRNFQASTFEGARALSGEELKVLREKGRGSCVACTIGCEHFFEIAPGAGTVKAEYENVFAFGPLCGVSDPSAVLAASRLADELGVDTISAGASVAFAMECAERGLFAGTRFEADAAGLRFGDAARLLSLLAAIGARDGALGDLLAEGTRRAADVLGPPAPDLAPHVKGLEIPGYEPRALQTMALGFAVAARGADHNRSGAYEADLSGKADRLRASPDAAVHAADAEERAAVLDALILCKFLRGALRDPFSDAAELYEAVVGRGLGADGVRAAGRRIVLLRRLFNEREGWTRAEDTLPSRFFDAPLPDGAARGAKLDRAGFAAAIEAYYAARGLDGEGRLRAAEREALEALSRLR